MRPNNTTISEATERLHLNIVTAAVAEREREREQWNPTPVDISGKYNLITVKWVQRVVKLKQRKTEKITFISSIVKTQYDSAIIEQLRVICIN